MFNILFGKRPRKNTIKNAAQHLIAIYGSTTTLEVKKYLRALGYVAFQYEISQKMDVICQEQNWGFDFNGTFRIYFIPQQMSVAVNNFNTNALPQFSAN